MEKQENKEDITKGEEKGEVPDDECNFVNPGQLRKEINRIIGNMAESKCPSEAEDESHTDICTEVNIKEQELKSAMKNNKKKRKVDISSSSDGKTDSFADSERTDVGIPAIADWDLPKKGSKEERHKKSAIVLDQMSKKKVYVPGKGKSELFRCPHQKIENVERLISLPAFKETFKVPKFIDKQVDRYHYNHFALRNNGNYSPRRNGEVVETGICSTGRLTLFKRLKLACLKGKDESKETKLEAITIEPEEYEEKPVCYCGSGSVNGNHQIGDEISSGESLDQIYKIKMEPSACPTSFIFRAVDRQASKCHGEVHFVVDSREVPMDDILENIRISKEQSAMVIPQGNQTALSSPNSGNLIEKEDKSQQIDSIQNDTPRQKQISLKSLEQDECLRKEYKPIRTKPERVDIYMFDHQDFRYFHTTDNPPPVLTEVAVQKVERIATQFWAEIFSVLHVIFAFLMSFILQTLKFVFLAIGRPLTTGVIQIFSDYFLKPLLTIVFNGIIQPPIIFIYNIISSFRDLCRPLATGLGYFVREMAQFVAAIRLCKILNKTNNGPFVAQPIPYNV